MTPVPQPPSRTPARWLLTFAGVVASLGLWLFGSGGTREETSTAAADAASTTASERPSTPTVTRLRLTDAFVYSTAKVQRHERWTRALAQRASGSTP